MESSWFFLFLLTNCITLCLGKTFFDSTTDEHALLAFRNGITSDPHGILSKNWSTSTSLCYWIGVSCGAKHRRVTLLNLSEFNLSGTIAPHLGNLTFLRYLDISTNNFTGSIPRELSKLHRLEEINFEHNWLRGHIPYGIFNISSMRVINLRYNRLSGRLPSDLCNYIPKLKALYLSVNKFYGQIPRNIYMCKDLEDLRLSVNHFTGGLPQELANISHLKVLYAGDNALNGSIPSPLFNISTLEGIDLSENEFYGTIPSDLCNNMPGLNKIYLFSNELDGQILQNIYMCRNLIYLALSTNRFNGNIPKEIGSLSMLVELDLGSNNFTGGIPTEIGNFSQLELLSIPQASLTGDMPKQIGNLTSLLFLHLNDNNLTGELPQDLANLAQMMEFVIYNNALFGQIPSFMFNISTLETLNLAMNHFSGTLPSDMEKLSIFNLKELYMYNNKLTGPIPSSITNASELTDLDLSSNSLSGSVPDFGNLKHLRSLRIWGNKMTGDTRFLSSLTNCLSLQVLQIGKNPYNEILLTSVGNLSISLEAFYANQCNVKGKIPYEIGNLTSLYSLALEGNELSGLIPTTVGKLKHLQELYLDSNQLLGYIPRDLCQISNLGDLDLSQNMLTGPIPECLGELQSLRTLYLYSNKLNSTMPSGFWNLRDLSILNLSSNNLSGRLSSNIGNLKVINQIDLSFNQFSGDIPSSVDGCQSLEVISLSNNKLEASIPQSLGNLRGLRSLDLSNNNLSGRIPKSFEDLHFLQNFNVSNNRLEGEIPTEGPFVNFTAQSFIRNFNLCGPTRFQVPPCIGNHKISGPNLTNYIWPPILLTIVLVIVILIMIRRRKQIKTQPPTDTSSLECFAWRRISYIELVRGTNAFSETNLLGRGSFGTVFKGTLSDGLNVAVKVFDLKIDGATKSFDTESEILSTIRHRNLIRIIGCCTNTEFKALILEYMPNGNLEKWLYSETHCLDMLQRLKVSIDVSLALEYLHHYHTCPVVHCDIKPSNVLLDEDMNARVTDFGIAKLFDEGEVVDQTKTLATIGYAAPEYGSEGKVSTKGDVYSYGIMLLEIFTRKKPLDDMFNEEMSLKDWVSEALQENAITEVAAPGLLAGEDPSFPTNKQCVESIFRLALQCLTFSPDKRMNMKEIVAALQKIKARVVAANRRNQPHAISTS